MTTLLSLTSLKRSACLVGIAFALAACATTQTTTTIETTSVKTAEVAVMSEETKNAEADDAMVCKKTTVVGSKFNKRVCATKAEWAARAEADRLTTDSIQRPKAPGVSN